MQKTAHHTAKVHKSFEKKKKLTQYFLPIHIKTKLYSYICNKFTNRIWNNSLFFKYLYTFFSIISPISIIFSNFARTIKRSLMPKAEMDK